ncbi:hypothetical protein TSL6_09770 [Sulfurovum sp. TSL6]|uniref:glycosyltransferase n=1 Tax=Sulfurovum sp. TSL6 TaxID=2826995 RepID=UPI001CC579E5|nr:glycosyltransferase [Sulfurovum sp. TSL6]GIU00471.1 hypothetical protein TSL6_09770 [Sulfurovum sp. TSL6]
MKILHLLTSINTGGAEKFCVDICNTQADISEHKVYLCILDDISEEQLLLKMISRNVNVISLNKRGGYSLKIIYKIYKLLSEVKPNIIHLNGRALVYTSIPILLKRIPSIYTVHTMAHKEYNKYIRSYIKLLFNGFPAIFTPVSISQSVSETVKKTYGAHFETVVYNGSSQLTTSSKSEVVAQYINTLKKDNNTLVFLYIGRISKEKNTLLLVKAFNELLDNGRNVCLCIVGYDGTLKQSYLLECKNENKYSDKVKFVGRQENIADYLVCADAFCLTSNYEGLGIAALEAFSMGIPVLSTPSGGPSDIIIPGINGYISEQITVESYIKVLNHFIEKPLRDKDKIIKLYTEKYTMEVCALQYLELYETKL